MKIRINICMGLLLMLASTPSGWAHGRLFAGTDTDEFGGLCNGRLASADTDGPVLVSPVTLIPVPFPINGLSEAPGFLLAGQPEDLPPGCPVPSLGNTLREIDYNGNLILQVPAGAPPFPNVCCNEQTTESPAGVLYHAHWPDEIERVRIIGGPIQSQVVTTFPQADVVGMTVVDSFDCNGGDPRIWITKWSGRSVGTWDPSTNTFVPRFSTPTNAGGLAWDGAHSTLWVGLQGGAVQPYDCNGNVIGPSFQPFGPIPDTVDGLAFVPDPL